MRLRRLCLEIFALRRFFREPMRFDQRSAMQALVGANCNSLLRVAQGFFQECGMLGRLDPAKNLRDTARGIDHE